MAYSAGKPPYRRNTGYLFCDVHLPMFKDDWRLPKSTMWYDWEADCFLVSSERLPSFTSASDVTYKEGATNRVKNLHKLLQSQKQSR